jgi:hypothetical protein
MENGLSSRFPLSLGTVAIVSIVINTVAVGILIGEVVMPIPVAYE